MRPKVKWMIILVFILCFSIYTFKYNLVNIQQSESSWKLSFGPRITITLKHFSKHETNTTNLGTYLSSTDTGPIKILLWSKLYANFTSQMAERALFPSHGKQKFACPLQYSFTTDRQEIDSADGVVVHIKQADNLPPKLVNSSMILQYDEPPIKYYKLQNEEFMNRFRYSIGYRLDSDFPSPRVHRPKIITPLDFHHKHDFAAAIFSNCTKARTEYATELSKFLRIKSFGDCLRNVEKNNVARIYEDNYIDSKIHLIRLFKFTLVFMKYDCKDYIDEQLNHAWSAGTLPVFLGTDSLDEMLPNFLKASYVSVSNFRQTIDLADYLESIAINRNFYERFMAWRTKSLRPSGESPLWKIWNPDYSPGCQMATKLLNDRLAKRSNKMVKAINCKERSIDNWLNRQPQKLHKIVHD